MDKDYKSVFETVFIYEKRYVEYIDILFWPILQIGPQDNSLTHM